MDSRLKERLIGAAVLVALGVWLIPWVLDGPERAPETEMPALELPAPQDSAPIRSQTIRLDRAPDATPTADLARVEHTAGAPAQPRAEDEPEAARVESGAAAPSRAPEARARVATPPVASGTDAWVVQLGSFGDAANAERLASRVGTYGYDASVSNFRAGGRLMHRVRVGPHANRDQAEAIASSLSAHGFVAQVVTAD